MYIYIYMSMIAIEGDHLKDEVHRLEIHRNDATLEAGLRVKARQEPWIVNS